MLIRRRQRKRNPRRDKPQKGGCCSLGSGGRSAIAQQQHLDNQSRVRASKNSRKHLGCSGAPGWLWRGPGPFLHPGPSARGCSGSCSAGICLPTAPVAAIPVGDGIPTQRGALAVGIPAGVWISHSGNGNSYLWLGFPPQRGALGMGIPACGWVSHPREALWEFLHPLGLALRLEGLFNHWL